MRDEAAVVGLRDAVEQRLGTPWLLVNVAGVFFEHDVTELWRWSDWDLIVDVNLKGTFLTCKTFLPAMLAEGSGCIVNIALDRRDQGRPHGAPPTTPSKGGVVLLHPQPRARPRRRPACGSTASARA